MSELTAIQIEIRDELSEAIEKLGGSPDLLAVVNSWGDTLPEEEILACMRGYNGTGSIWKEKYCDCDEAAGEEV